jgi:excisionase family DNA binding protein
MSIEDTVTPQEAATILGIDIRTIRDWITQGVLESFKVSGNRRRIPRSALQGRLTKNQTPIKKGAPKLAMRRYCYGFEIPDNFDLITTYKELTQYTTAFSRGDITFLLLVGSPGSGKSRQMKADFAGKHFKWIDNHASNLGLYCAVYEADSTPVVLDDINHLFRCKMACSLMKALTQTEKRRSVSWESTAKILEDRNVPRQFETSSPMCLIANMWDGSNPDMAAIQDRALPVAFFPAAETVHNRVLELKWCNKEVSTFIGLHLADIPQPSMREYYQAMTYRKAGMDWKEKLLKIWGKN